MSKIFINRERFIVKLLWFGPSENGNAFGAIFIVTLDIDGYRYGAQRLARSYTLSLVTLIFFLK